MAGHMSDEDDVAYGERWDQERLAYERGRFEERDRYYTRGDPFSVSRERFRDANLDERYVERRVPRPWEDRYSHDMRYYEESPQRRTPPPEPERRTYLETIQDREYHNASPLPRSNEYLRPQSSIDSFDRPPAQRYYDRDDYPTATRRRESHLDSYQAIPLPRSRALPPPRIYAENDYEEIRVADPYRYEDDDLRAYPERVLEREIVKVEKPSDRGASRTGRTRRYHSRSRHSSSRSSPVSSSSSNTSSGSGSGSSSSSNHSDTGGTSITARSEQPKKGRTKIPIHLVSFRAIADLDYNYSVDGKIVIIYKALGQSNIDELLKLSCDYKKADAELTAAQSISSAGVEERKQEVYTIPAQAPRTLVRAPVVPSIEIVKEPMVVDAASSQGYSAYNAMVGPSASCSCLASRNNLVVEAGLREDHALVGPVAHLADRRTDHHRHHHRLHRSRSRGAELIRAERFPTGELVMYEEVIERVEEPRRGVRIEKDKKGRMSISVPKHRK